MAQDLNAHFPRYTEFEPVTPVWCVTPEVDGAFHRFFDTSPFSPSGRYVGLTRLLSEDRLPEPGDPAEIVVVDLEGGSHSVVAETRGWDTQLGAQVQWGATDDDLFYNDLDTETWQPYGVKLDPGTGTAMRLDGTVYMVSADGRTAASPCLLRTALTQAGYGVVVPDEHVPRNDGASEDDGLYVTDTGTGDSRLLVSFADIVEAAWPALPEAGRTDGAFYGFHVKWDLAGDRLMLVLRFKPNDAGEKTRANLITMRADGSDINVAIPSTIWTEKGGHHPNWCPDGEHVMMNINEHGDGMRFVQARFDGTDYRVMTEAVRGSGHPALHPNGRHIVTDAYPKEPVSFGDGTVPIRLVDLAEGAETTLARMQIVPPFTGPKNELRVDPHPAWDRGFRRIAFNGCPDVTRRVYVADLSELVE